MPTINQINTVLRQLKYKKKIRGKVRTPEPVIQWVETEEEARAFVPGQRAPNGAIIIAIAACYRDYWENNARWNEARGGRSSGKSLSFARLLMIKVIWRGSKLLCCREIQDSIEESSHAELVQAVKDLDALGECVITDKYIKAKQGGRVKYIGLAKTGEKVRGYSSYDQCWVEEAATVTADSWNRLTPTIRLPGAQIWVTWNPISTISATWKMFVSECIYPEYAPDGSRFRISKHINFDQNPWHNMTSLAMDERLLRDADEDLHAHIWLGQPVGDSPMSIIKTKWLIAAENLHDMLQVDYEDGAHLIAGYDVGGTSQGDPSVLAMHMNNVLCYLNEFREVDPVASAKYVWHEARRMECAEVRFDVIGVGLGAKGAVRELNDALDDNNEAILTFRPYDAGGAVVNPNQLIMPKRKNADHFLNAKAQSWYDLAKRAENAYLVRKYYTEAEGSHYERLLVVEEKMGADRMRHLMSVDTIRIETTLWEKAKGELCEPRWIMNEGKLQVETKKQMAQRNVPSTNNGDAIVMAYTPMRGGVNDEQSAGLAA